MTIPSIVARSVSKTYRRGRQSITALQNVSLEVSQGELALLVGPSGSGKTTLLNLIAALDRPDRGEILVEGLDDLPPEKWTPGYAYFASACCGVM